MHRFKVSLVAIAAAAGTSIAWTGWANAEEGSDAILANSQIADYYLQVAFGAEAPWLEYSGRDDLVRKWDIDATISILPIPSPTTPTAVVEIAKDIVGELQSHSGGLKLRSFDRDGLVDFLRNEIPPSRVMPRNSLVINIGSREELLHSIADYGSIDDPADIRMRDYLKRAFASFVNYPALCIGLAGPRRDEVDAQVLGQGMVWIEYGPMLRECLYEEVMQMFGISNDLPFGSPSMFNDDGVYTSPTPLDWKLWRIHTDPRIQPGMTKESARKAALEILTPTLW